MGLTLPTVERFLLIYSLRAGSIVVLIWSFFRSLFTIFFYVIMILESFVYKPTSSGSTMFVHVGNSTTDDNVFQVYYCSMLMVVAETFLMVFCLFLALGIFAENCQAFPEFMICRFVTWLIEVTCLFVLCVVHKLLIGWYLGIFFFVILEFYGFVIVYSLYVEMCVVGCQTCKAECADIGITRAGETVL